MKIKENFVYFLNKMQEKNTQYSQFEGKTDENELLRSESQPGLVSYDLYREDILSFIKNHGYQPYADAEMQELILAAAGYVLEYSREDARELFFLLAKQNRNYYDILRFLNQTISWDATYQTKEFEVKRIDDYDYVVYKQTKIVNNWCPLVEFAFQ